MKNMTPSYKEVNKIQRSIYKVKKVNSNFVNIAKDQLCVDLTVPNNK